MPDLKQPFQIISLGGQTFEIFQEIDEEFDTAYLIYPDFEKEPLYTDKGRPFATAGQESCEHGLSRSKEADFTDDCGGCLWFHREATPVDLIGICMCDALLNIGKD